MGSKEAFYFLLKGCMLITQRSLYIILLFQKTISYVTFHV